VEWTAAIFFRWRTGRRSNPIFPTTTIYVVSFATAATTKSIEMNELIKLDCFYYFLLILLKYDDGDKEEILTDQNARFVTIIK
jgi:hypothetical protein